MVKTSALVHQSALGRAISFIVLVLACAVSYAGEDKSPKPLVTDLPPATKEQALPEVDWSASKQSFDEARNAVILAGSAWVRYRGNKLEADNIVFFRESREMYAEGNIRLRAGESEMAAQAAYVDVNNDTGYLIDAVVRVSAPPTALKGLGGKEAKDEDPDRAENRSTLLNRSKDPYGVYLMPAEDPQARTNLVFKAQKIVKQGRMLYSAEDAFITSDDMVHPMYGVKAGSLDFYMYEVDDPQNPGKKELKPQKVVVKRARLNILGTSLFPFPTLKYDIEKRSSFFDAHFGNSDRWGPFMLTRFGYNLEGGENKIFDPTRVYLDLDERMERGPAAGFELDWQSGVRPVESGEKKFERGQGHLRVYAIDEIQTSRSDALRRARRDLERRIQPKIDGFPRQQYDANLLFTRRRRLEDAGPPSFDLDIRRDDFRGMIDFQQHQPLKRLAGVDNLLLDLKFQRESDRDFLHEYFYRDYLNQNQPEALASLRKPGDNYSVELLYRGSTQDFDAGAPRSPTNFGTFTNYQPALTYSLVSTPLPGGFYLRSELQGARLKREFERSIYDQESFDANRAYAIVDFSRPIKWGPLNFVPHIGTQQQIYDNSRQGETTSQGALTYGFDLSSRIYGTFPEFENEALGLQGGLRHIIEPRISYNVVGDTRESAEDLLDFDQIDDLTPVDRMTFAVEQTFQTKRATKEGGTRTVNFAGFDVAMDFLPRNRDQERLLGGDALDLVRVDGFLRVLDVVKVAGHLGVRPQDLRTERAAYSITIDPGTRWRLKLEERFHFADSARSIVGSDQIHVKFEYQLSERWAVAFERVSEARKSLQTRKGRQVERVSVTRSYGPLDATLTYSVDRNLGEKSVFASVRPTATYRNLIVPSQDLLVASGELTGEEDTPEERNFDPFDLLRQRKQKRNKSDGKFTNPPGPIRDQDVPTPPTPGSDARGDGARKSDNTALFRDPNEPVNASTRQSAIFKDPNERPAKPARKVDEDDWTAPTTPASTRK